MKVYLGDESLAVRVLVQAVEHRQAGGGGGRPAQERRPPGHAGAALGLVTNKGRVV